MNSDDKSLLYGLGMLLAFALIITCIVACVDPEPPPTAEPTTFRCGRWPSDETKWVHVTNRHTEVRGTQYDTLAECEEALP